MSTLVPDRAVLRVVAPLAGRAVALADVPDPVFAGELVGPGIAVDPPRTGDLTAVAPVDGTVTKVHPHAVIITAGPDAPGRADADARPDAPVRTAAHPAGTGKRAVLVHLGLDTVRLEGAGLTVHVREGQQVVAGAAMVTWDPAAIEAGGLNPIVPVIALQAGAEDITVLAEPGQALAAGAPLIDWR